jgi:hypothetical protein
MSSSIPDITHVHDSSPTKGVSSHVNNPAAAFASTSSITPFDLNSQIDDLLVTSLHTEITNNNDKSDVFMIPSIPSLFKERLVEQGINAERQAMLVSESGDVEMDMRIYGEGGEGGDGGGRNSGANKDPLPFNRLDWEEAFVGGRAESKKDVGMADGEDKQIVEGFFGGLL